MSAERFESIWFLINQYDFKFDASRYSDLICGMCGKLLSEAMQSSCSCKFCRRCIEIHCENNSVTCPGLSELCKSTVLDLDEDVIVDHTTNKRISLLKVKCPFDQCPFEDKLIHMESHVKMCDKKPKSRQQSELNLENAELINEIQINEVIHLKLLIESIDNLRNENKMLSNEIISLKETQKLSQISMEKFRKQIEKMNEKMDQIIENQKTLSVKFEENFNEKQSDQQSRMKTNSTGKRERIKKVPKSQNILGELLWKIDNFSATKKSLMFGDDRWLDSAEFCTSPSRYKMQLRMWIGEPNVDILIKMISNEDDKYIQWPIKVEVNIGLLNPENGNLKVNETKIIEYQTASFTSKAYFHFHNSSVNKVVVKHDSLVVKCLAKDLIVDNRK